MRSAKLRCDGTVTAENQANGKTFHIANTDFAISGVPESWWSTIPEKLLSTLKPEAEPAEKALVIAVNICPDDSLAPPPAAIDVNQFSSLEFHRDHVIFHSFWFRGLLNLEHPLTLRLDCHPEGEPYFAGILENALRLMVAYKSVFSGGVLLHSAALVIDGHGVVVFGHSGAGKSTISNMALKAGYPILSDDINVINRIRNQWRVYKVPFCGTVQPQQDCAASYPLAGLYRLRQDTNTRLKACSPANSIALLCGSAPFVNQDQFRLDCLIDTLSSLNSDHPVNTLHFRKNPDFLHLLPGHRPEGC